MANIALTSQPHNHTAPHHIISIPPHVRIDGHGVGVAEDRVEVGAGRRHDRARWLSSLQKLDI